MNAEEPEEPTSKELAIKLQRIVTEPVTHQALNVFLSDTIMPAADGSASKGHFTNLIALVQSSSDSDALPLALQAVALASLASRVWSSELQLEAARRYTNSIHQLRKDLSSTPDGLRVLGCILLLSLYEVR
jgi:hypothetical protein